MQTKQHHRLLALLMTLVMVFQFTVVTPHYAFAETTEVPVSAEETSGNEQHNATKVEEATEPLRADGELTLLGFTSDTHNTSGNTAATRLGTWLDKMESIYGKKVDVMAFGGDMAGAGASGYWDLTQADMNKLTDRSITGVYTTGNHEISYGGDFSYSTYTSGGYSSTETKGQFKISTQGYEGSNFRIYCLGSRSSSSSYTDSVSSLTSYLNSVGNDKPIFIITHFPLHYYTSRSTSGASDVIDALNNAVNNNGQKIVFLWGHNHTMSDTYYDYIYRPGDSIPTSSSSSSAKTIQFYYGAAGCMSDSDYGTGSASVKGKGLLVTINSKKQLSFTYYDANGKDVSEGGTYTEQDPVSVTGVSLSPATASVLERQTVQLTATVAPADATNKKVTWTSSNTGIATVDEKGLVRGVAEGTATITVKTDDGGKTATSTITVTHNDNASTEVTVDVTPTTSNPEETEWIAIGDTLVINVTNGSSSSAYDFTLSFSKSGVAQAQGNTTVNIAAGATGQFTVEGISDGTVDITIQNSNQYGSSYVRKATVHLTVGEGGSSVDPPVGDTVSITPSTDNPEESIKINVGDTLTINVTNGSSNSAYDFTASLSKSGVAQISGNSTVNIAAGATGQFTVTGLANGTVDITIQNNSSYGSQYVRKGVIHLTVGEGGDTPVDPPVGDTVDITPSTDNPEESIKIAVGDTLTVNVKNGSSNSAYDFTATLSNSGIAQIEGSSTINIAAGSTAQFTFKGLAEGTVDITIQNENSYGSQYVRKGIVHLTVGEGGTPVDPPVGDTVTYQLATAMEAGKEYIIANANSGSVYVLSTDANGSRTLKGISATVTEGLLTLSATDAAKAVFKAEGQTSTSGTDSFWLTNSGKYLYADSNSGLRLESSSTATSSSNSSKVWHYKADGKNLLWFFKDASGNDGYTDTSSTYKYYLECSSGNFTDNHVSTTSLANTSTPAIYLFEKYEGELEVTGVSLNKISLTLVVGKTETLTATVLPSGATNKEVTWQSSNPSVATVDANGKVTAVAAGTATITVTTVENSKTATCAVTVKEPGEGITYVLTDKLEDGKEYLIASGNSGSVYIVSNEAGSAKQLKGISVEVISDSITIEEEIAEKATFAAESRTSSSGSASFWLTNGGKYLYADSSDGLRLTDSSTQTSSSNSGKVWHYKADGKNLLWFFKDTSSSDGYTDTSSTYKYYLTLSSGVFTDNHASTTSLANTSTPAMYLFVKDESGPQPHTHTYGDPVWTWASDNSSATMKLTCTAGDDTQTITVPATETVVSAATCTADKVVSYTATVTLNGKSYSDTKANVTIEGTALGHDFGEWTVTKAATCTEKGEETKACSRCDVKETREIEALGHDWNEAEYEWADDNSSVTATTTCKHDSSHKETETVTTTSEVTKAATCDERGETTYKATFTKEAFATQTMTVDDVPALGHDFGEWTVTTPATCTENGEETRICSRCGETETRPTDALGHDFGEWTVTKAATCTEKGEETRECSRCDAKETREIDALGHALVHNEAQAATCTEAGWNAYDECTRCDYTTYVEIPALGHEWGTPEYTWADDYSTVTAKTVCEHDATHIEEETAETTATVIKEATTTEEGQMLYEASFENELFAKQSKLVAIPKEPTYEVVFKQFANTSQGIIVQWYAVEDPDLKDYTLYRSESGKNQWVLVKEHFTETKVTDTAIDSLKSGTKYDYRVVVTKKDGNTYDGLREAWYYLGVTTMNAPTCTRAGIRVTWPKVEGATKYVVFRSIGSGTPSWNYLTTVEATDDAIQTLNTKAGESGSWYAYTVRAIFVDEEGNETYGGQPAGRSILYRAPVKVVKAESISSGVRVTFQTVKAGYTYRLYRSTKTASGWSDYEKITDLVKSYTGETQDVWIYDKTAENGQTYKYYVRCVSKDGAVPLSSYDNEFEITYKKP